MTAQDAIGKKFRFRVGNGWQIYDEAKQTNGHGGLYAPNGGTRIKITQNILTSRGWSKNYRYVYPIQVITKV